MHAVIGKYCNHLRGMVLTLSHVHSVVYYFPETKCLQVFCSLFKNCSANESKELALDLNLIQWLY